MKKILLSATFSLLSLAACTRVDESASASSSSDSSTSITFGSYVGISTKGAVTALLEDDDSLSMGVFGFYTDEDEWSDVSSSTQVNFMYNQEVATLDGGSSWSYSPIKYWSGEDDDYFTFFAYAPYTAASTASFILSSADDVGAPSITINISSDNLADMVDFVAGRAVDITYTSSSGKVNFSHKHETSRAGFKAKLSTALAEEDNTAVILKSVTLNDATGASLYSSATFTFDFDSDQTIGVWGDYSSGATQIDLADILATTTITWGAGGEYSQSGIALADTLVSIFTSGEYLFLIPVEASSCSSGITVEVVYDVVTSDSALSGGYSVIENTEQISLPSSVLLQGKAYNFNLVVGVNEVELCADEIEDWSEEEYGDITAISDAISTEP